MSLYDKASLVMIPSGYKDDKLFSIKPTDGSGDFTFSRDGAGASPATRVNASGLIEKGYTNNVLQSNTFSSGTWLKQVSGGTTPVLTSGFPDPEGGSNAWRLQCSITGGLYSMMSQALSTAGLNCNSIWIKSNTGSDQDVYFRINNADQTTTRTATATWQRIEVFTDAVGQSFTIGVRNAATGATSSCDVLIYAAQSNEGLVGLPIVETTTAPVSAGLLGDMPRLDYSGGATCPSLLLEPSRVNVIEHSEYIDSYYTFNDSTITDNAATSPEGVQNASKFVEGGTNSAHNFQRTLVVVDGDYAFSIYAKAGERDFLIINAYAGASYRTWFNLSTGVVGTNASGNTAKVEDMGNGWYRCSVSRSFSGTKIFQIGVASGDNVNAYQGDGTSGIYIYGAQAESGSYVSSYIPTYGSAAPRGADVCSKTGISSLIGQTEGTLFIELSSLSDSIVNEQISLSDGTDSNTIKFVMGSVISGIQAESRLGGVTQFSIKKTTSDYSSVKKMAVSYKQNDVVFYIDGVQIGTDSVATIPALSVFNFAAGSGVFKATGNIKQALLFKTRLTNAELAALTA